METRKSEVIISKLLFCLYYLSKLIFPLVCLGITALFFIHNVELHTAYCSVYHLEILYIPYQKYRRLMLAIFPYEWIILFPSLNIIDPCTSYYIFFLYFEDIFEIIYIHCLHLLSFHPSIIPFKLSKKFSLST